MSMSETEIRQLLGYACANDGRKWSEGLLLAWQVALQDASDPQECLLAMRAHYQERPGVWLEPGHILERIRIKQRAAAERKHEKELHEQLPPLEHERSHQAYLAALAEYRRARYGE